VLEYWPEPENGCSRGMVFARVGLRRAEVSRKNYRLRTGIGRLICKPHPRQITEISIGGSEQRIHGVGRCRDESIGGIFVFEG